MIDIKDFPEGTKLNFFYTAPITDFYGKKLPYRHYSINQFPLTLNTNNVKIPFLYDKIDYSEIVYFGLEMASANNVNFITNNLVFDMPKIKELGFTSFRPNSSGNMFTLNLGDDFEKLSGVLQYSSSNTGTFTLNSTSKKIKTLTNCKVDNTIEFRVNCDCENLTSSPYTGIYSTQNVTTFHSGFPNCKYSSTGNYYDKIPNLTYESCISILNNLYDFTGNGETPTSSQGRLKVHQNFLDKVGDEISIGTSRGWTITA